MEHTDSGRPDEMIQQKDVSGKKSRASHSGSSSGRRSSRGRRNAKADSSRYLIAQLLALVCIVLVIFEGNVIYRLFSHHVGSSVEIMNDSKDAQTEGLLQDSAASGIASATQVSTPTSGGNASVVALAGGDSVDLPEDTSSPGLIEEQTQTQTQTQSSESINNPKVVPERDTAVDDFFFNNAVFIGDSRMEGFRNASGITQGTFLTGVGLAIDDMDKPIISTTNGNISVYQGLSGHQYDKIYLMLGANDLGYYPWELFLEQFTSVLAQFHELQPQAIIYVCSVIYVDESKIAPGFEYDNNDNVRTINGYILEACDNLWYSYYLNLNEIFSDGNGSLISDASPDGIHLYPDYLAMMLNYLKTHYLTDEEFDEVKAAHPDDIANKASSSSESEETVESGLIEEADDGAGEEEVSAS